MRLNRYLAGCGLGSRRKMDTLIQEGRVSVNGTQVTGPGLKVAPGDTVLVDGQPVSLQEESAVYLLNKPAGFLTTLSDPQGRPTIKDFINDIPERLYPAGRLDMDTRGLLLLTNMGDLCHRMTHPSFGVEKEYAILADAVLTPQKKRQLEQGVRLEEGMTSPAKVLGVEKGGRRFRLVLHEGWNRQVRRMCLEVGLKVLKLERIRYAFLTLDGVPRGELRRLTGTEVAKLQEIVGLVPGSNG